MITAAFLLTPAALVGLSASVVTLINNARMRQRRAALLREALGRQ
jgi:hypothetical protein